MAIMRVKLLCSLMRGAVDMNPIPALLIGLFCGLSLSAFLFVAAAMLHGRCEHEEHPLLWMDDYDGEWEGS